MHVEKLKTIYDFGEAQYKQIIAKSSNFRTQNCVARWKPLFQGHMLPISSGFKIYAEQETSLKQSAEASVGGVISQKMDFITTAVRILNPTQIPENVKTRQLSVQIVIHRGDDMSQGFEFCFNFQKVPY
jgi:hypothetical protein